MGGWEKKTEEEKEKLIYEEESIVFSLCMLFAQHMMYLRVPTNACVEMRKIQHMKKLEHERRMQQQAAAGGESSALFPKAFNLSRSFNTNNMFWIQ